MFTRRLARARAAVESDGDEFEGINTSEMGLATDLFLALNLAQLATYLTSTWRTYFTYMSIAFLIGGFSHKLFANRAADGTGQPMMYTSFTIAHTSMTIAHGVISPYELLNTSMWVIQAFQAAMLHTTRLHASAQSG
jgi:hypothetical protein